MLMTIKLKLQAVVLKAWCPFFPFKVIQYTLVIWLLTTDRYDTLKILHIHPFDYIINDIT